MEIMLSEIIIQRLAQKQWSQEHLTTKVQDGGHNLVTSTIVRQLVSMHSEEQTLMKIGDVQTFRDWSHVLNVVDGYILLAEKADPGSVYVQGVNEK